ncbi:MAG: GyrI-like domain-containing protein [Chloroflexota bacterium]|nr:GyrI-like domain-containing protein [Chloroflexota bacterium]
MKKLDLRKDLKYLYSPSAKKVEIVDVPKMNFLMLDGVGNPNTSQEYQDALGALYNVAYTLKFMLKLKIKPAVDYPVMALEGLWWVEGVEQFTMEQLMGRKDEWKWTMMIMQPDIITRDLVAQAIDEARRKKDSPSLDKIRLERYNEGRCAQIMHIGPYSAEQPTIERLHAFIKESGHALRGKHHEIYMGDPRRTKPERLKTILRQPMR